MENKVSGFLVSTCRMKTEFCLHDNSFIPLSVSSYFGMSCTQLPSGSQAEFYIQTINSCIEDLDVLLVSNNYLALDSNAEIPEGVGDLCDVIQCSKLESYEQNKSFVRLCDPTVGTYDWKSEEYKFQNTPWKSFMRRDCDPSPNFFLRFLDHTRVSSHINGELTELNSVVLKAISTIGPAIKYTFPNLNHKVDAVMAINCPNWPLVAEEWPKRRRYNGWPNSETLRKVVRDGCDVVSVTHRDMPEELNQWRLSFSRAEATLIQSCTPTQQIVYHLLRFFAKREIIRQNCPKKEEVVCTYHLKTLMLWSCEEESTEWWETLSVVAICCNLCGKLCECLKHKRCPNYFIPEANLLDHELDLQVLQQTVKALNHYKDVKQMSQWFATHYILPVYNKLCNEDDIFLTEEMVETCIISVCDYNEKRKLKDLDKVIFGCAHSCFCFCLKHSHGLVFTNKQMVKAPDSDVYINFFLDTSTVSKTLSYYIKAIVLFHMSQSVLNNTLQGDVETLSGIWIHIIRQSYFMEKSNSMQPLSVSDKSMVYFNGAEQIMKHLVSDYSKNESYFATMVSMLCLQESLCCHDRSSYITQTASRLYLAALLYYIGHRQCTVHLCSAVVTSFKERAPCRNVRNLKVKSLLFMDDLATIAGFLQLRRKIRRTPSKEISFLSPNLFVHYLFILCNPKELEIKEAPQMELSFEADYCLTAMMRYKTLRHIDTKTNKTLIYSGRTEDAEGSTIEIVLPGTHDVADALSRISNDYMTHFYTSLSEEFGTKFNLGPCYEAISLYKCRRHEDVIFMCEKFLEDPGDDSELEEFQFLNVNVCTYFMAYFDEDIQTLVGFQLLALRLSSIRHRVFDYFLHHRPNIEGLTCMTITDRISQSALANMLFWKTFKPILRKQFLGNYLKLRCLLDLEFPLLEVISAFKCLKGRFPFENSLVHFMHKKINRYCRAKAAI